MSSESNVLEWATAVSRHEGNVRVIIFRFAERFAAHFKRASQPSRIIIVWRYESQSGQPQPDDLQRMHLLEDALGRLAYHEEFATLALVSTGEGLREWIYYAKTENEFIERLNQAVAGTSYPLEIHTAFDPTWTTYDEFRRGLAESSA